MPAWTVDVDGVEEPNQFYVEIKDTANPFGDVAVVSIHDRDGTRFDAYEPGTPIDIFIYPDGQGDTLLVQSGDTETIASGEIFNSGRALIGGQANIAGQLNVDTSISRTLRFPGFVADRDEREENGNDILDVTVHTYDQLLRGEVIQEDLSGQSISSALNTIVTEYTPVTWNASNVTVVDDRDLTQSFRGEKVENALLELSFKSAAEGFGVNQDLEFFFRPIEASPAPRDVGPAEIFDVEIEEDGRAAPNEVTVFYDDGNQSVTVDRGAEKILRQEQLGTDRPVAKAVELSRPDVTTIDDARDIGERYLENRASRFRGKVTTFDLFDAEIGDVINVRSVSKDLDDDYRVAAIEYIDTSETRVTIVDQRTDQDERLVNLGDSVDRIETRDVDRDAIRNRVTNTEVRALLDTEATAGGTTVDTTQTRFTNTGRTKIRDAWAGGATLDITEIAVGSDSTNLNRTNTALESETERVSASQSLPTAQSVTYDGTLSQNRNVSEIGLFDAAGDLVVRATFDPFVQTDTVSVTVDVQNDPDVPKSVLTEGGQTAVRDIIADNTPAVPDAYAYGSDDTDPTETDTALGNELTSQSLSEILIQSAATAAQWAELTSIEDTDPLTTANGQLELLQSAFTQPDEDATTEGSVGFVSDAKYTNSGAENISDTGHAVIFTFDVEYTIPEADFDLYVLIETSNLPAVDFTVIDPDGSSTNVFSFNNTGGSIGYDWAGVTGDDFGSSEWDGGDITPGTYEVRIEQTSANGNLIIDGIAPLDNRYTYTFDNGNGHKDGPELYPDQVIEAFTTATTSRDVTEANFTSTWNDTSGNQYIEIANDGSTFTRFDNSSSGSTTFAGAETGVDTIVSLSRYGTQTDTPTSGINGQTIDDYNLFANPDAVAPADIDATDTQVIIPPGTLTGSTVKEGGIKSSGGTLLTRSVFAGIDITANVQLVSSERTQFANTT